ETLIGESSRCVHPGDMTGELRIVLILSPNSITHLTFENLPLLLGEHSEIEIVRNFLDAVRLRFQHVRAKFTIIPSPKASLFLFGKTFELSLSLDCSAFQSISNRLVSLSIAVSGVLRHPFRKFVPRQSRETVDPTLRKSLRNAFIDVESLSIGRTI